MTCRRLALSAVAATVTAAISMTMLPTATAAPEGTILGAGAPDAVKGSYLVVLKDDARIQSLDSVAYRHSMRVTRKFSTALRGFAATMSEGDAKRAAADPAIAYVEQDRVVRLAEAQPNPPSWGLDRVDQRSLPLDGSYTSPNSASGVTAYILDTGVRISHGDFGGRATWGHNAVDGNNTDCHGHGTHVAGTVGGSAHGVAKGVRLVAVKVLNCQGGGTLTSIVAGVDWVTANAVKPAVANMSLGGRGASAALETAVLNSIRSGVTYVLASGNSNADACGFSPARLPEGITVNATDRTDARWAQSNYGTCTDLFAPGHEITSAWHSGDSATKTISGTSMAAPHVAGAAALHLGADPTASPGQVQAALKEGASKGRVTTPGSGSTNNLLFIGEGTDPGPGPVPEPCAGITAWSASDAYYYGAQVSHNGHIWVLRTYYSYGQAPGKSWVWSDKGPC